MALFEITTAVTAYTDYRVEAASLEEALEIISDDTQRADYAFNTEAGYGDDEEIVGYKEISS